MPQLDFFWWGFSFFFCWLFFLFLYIYFLNYKLFLFNNFFLEGSYSSFFITNFNFWLW
uniref:ATP synthase F0 subunit 8 n=1 Tax=Cenometra bella TaxID=707711 RepID=UPI001EF9F647|nr:ATP synthase F0 subunit 8 [Cenometra bella]UKZ50761.1 ATP synthase F0 subunit 8 [Cenometra bella]